MGDEAKGCDGFSNYETWAYFELLTNFEDTLRYWLAEAERVRGEVGAGRDEHSSGSAVDEACRTVLAERLRGKHLDAPRDGVPEDHGRDAERVAWCEIARALLVEPPSPRRPRFPLGLQVITPGAFAALSPLDICVGVVLHSRGVWGEIDEEDSEENERSLSEGGRLLSAYHAKDETRFYVITEQDRSVTTVLLPGEY